MAGLVCSQGRVRDEVGAMLHMEGSFWLPAGKKKYGASFVRSSARNSSAWSVGFASLSLFQDGELTQDESGSWRESMLL